MKKAPDILSTFSLSASVNITTIETSITYEPVIVASLPDTAIGKINGPIPMEKQASKIQLPMVFPIASSCWLLRMAGQDQLKKNLRDTMCVLLPWSRFYYLLLTVIILVKAGTPTSLAEPALCRGKQEDD